MSLVPSHLSVVLMHDGKSYSSAETHIIHPKIFTFLAVSLMLRENLSPRYRLVSSERAYRWLGCSGVEHEFQPSKLVRIP
jgi:hypothetical protein